MFRIEGDISFDNLEVVDTEKIVLNANKKIELFSFFQYLKPLTPENPCFLVQINDLHKCGNLTIGIAGVDIDEKVTPGSWNNTIGYETLTGKCTSSHRMNANTLGRPVFEDDTLGVLVANFGNFQSTIIFFINNEVVATRYHFETDHSKFLPTITFDDGPIEVDLFLPEVVDKRLIKCMNETNDITFIKPSYENCILNESNEYVNIMKSEDMPLQSPVPLSVQNPYYECILLEVSEKGQGASVGIASCSPLKPTPTCDLLRDYYTWLPKMKLQVGNSIGWGIFYNPDTPSVNDKAEQLVLVYVTLDDSIVDILFVLQPEGGFFPLVLMQPWASRTGITIKNSTNPNYFNKLRKVFYHKLQPALEIYNKDVEETAIHKNDITKVIHVNDSIDIDNSVELKMTNPKTTIQIPAGNPGLHYIQYTRPLTPERRFFFIEIISIGPETNVTIGVGPSTLLENDFMKLPGEMNESTGYHSLTGLMFYNGNSHGNMTGQKCTKGDTMGLEIEVFEQEMSVAIFSKNFKAIGTRFITLKDHYSFLPTIAILNSGEEVKLNVYWHTVVSMPPHFNVRNPNDWCVPEGTKIDQKEKLFTLPDHLDHSLCIQAPYSLHQKYNHFEIILIDDFDKNNPPPAIALCSASPLDPPPVSKFKQDFLRFWPVGEAMSAVKKYDRVGWGIFYVDENLCKDNEQLIICFLTINRNVVYLRVLNQPPGGLYPVVIAPPNVYKIRLDTSGARVNTEDLKNDQLKLLIMDTNKQIENEKRMIALGKNPREEADKRSKTCSIL